MTTFTDGEMTLAARTDKAERYLAFIKKQLPDYEPQSRAYLEYDYLYPHTENAEKHYRLAYEYLNKYEPVAKEFHSEAHAICFSEVNQNTKQIGLNCINKAIELAPQREYYICKAELLYQLNRIDEARQALAISAKDAPDVKDKNALYYRRVKKLLDEAR
jgi:tetratricopeptide (TPR) repeat protein